MLLRIVKNFQIFLMVQDVNALSQTAVILLILLQNQCGKAVCINDTYPSYQSLNILWGISFFLQFTPDSRMLTIVPYGDTASTFRNVFYLTQINFSQMRMLNYRKLDCSKRSAAGPVEILLCSLAYQHLFLKCFIFTNN